jgi:hypothetical protein
MAGHKLLKITTLQASKLFDDLDVDDDGKSTLSPSPSLLTPRSSPSPSLLTPRPRSHPHSSPFTLGELTKEELIEGYLKHPDGFESNREMADVRERATQVMLQEYLEGDNWEAKLPYRLRNNLASTNFVKSCEIWFHDLDTDGNGVLDQDELMPILDLLYEFLLQEMHRDLDIHEIKVRPWC